MDKIVCVGKNYLKHAIEIGGPIPEAPMYFLKPQSALREIAKSNETVNLPALENPHHEIELVFRVKRVEDKLSLSHVTLGLDLTLRNLQGELKKAGQPWEKAKVFACSAIVGPWREMPAGDLDQVLGETFELRVNGELRQQAQGLDMRWGPEFLLRDLPQWFPMCDGDLLFTGTPEGVGPLKPGDDVSLVGLGVDYGFQCVR